MIGVGELIDGMCGDLDISRLPEFSDVGGYPGPPHRDKFDTGLLAELQDVFWRPFRVIIEGIDDGFPGVDCHDFGKHVWIIDLHNEPVEQR